jgi:hypothetical protein
MASLHTTPTEILHFIFASLSPGDLAAICLTHRDLRYPVEPFLYAHIQWIWSDSKIPPVAQFLRSIIHRPELARYVYDVTLDGDCFDGSLYDPRNESPKIPVSNVVLDELVECIKRTNVPYVGEWIQELRAGSMDAFTTRLISHLLNLKRLFLDKNFNRESRLRGMMLRSPPCEETTASNLSSFTYLEDVTAKSPCLPYDIHQKSDSRNTKDVLPLFYLPSVKRIRTLIDNPATFTLTGKNLPNPSRLTSLDLTILRERHLSKVLSIRPSLQKLN